MSNNSLSNKITICCAIFLWTLGAQASTLPPDPNNAALLYYQAFLLRPEPDAAAKELVYGTRLETIDKLLRGGKLDPDPEVEIPEIEKSIRELEEKIRNRRSDPNEETSDFEQALYKHNLFIEERELQFLKKSRERYEKMCGIDPDKKIREYLRKCDKAIGVAQAASEISECDWGIRYSQGFSHLLPQLIEIRDFLLILRADALLLAADEDYRAAFRRCLMMRRFARHVGDDANLLYSISITVDRNALSCIQHLLGYMKPDIETLTWLKNQLSIKSGASMSPARSLKLDVELAVQSLRMSAVILENTRQAMLKKEQIKALVRERLAQNTGSAKEVQILTDEELISLARKPYDDFLNSALQVMDSGMPYEKKYAEIERLTDELEKEFGGDTAAKIMILAHPEKILTLEIVMACADQVLKLYNVHVRHATQLNALKAAVEIYLVRAKTRKLPEELPDYLPKDPYTGRDFGYEITDEGFALRCQGEDFQKERMRQMLEFKVKSRD